MVTDQTKEKIELEKLRFLLIYKLFGIFIFRVLALLAFSFQFMASILYIQTGHTGYIVLITFCFFMMLFGIGYDRKK